MVSNTYVEKTYLEENNNKHIIKIINKTKNIDITDYLELDEININQFLENETNSISPNTLNLTFALEVNGNRENIELKSIRNSLIEEENIIEIIDIFNEEEIVIFKGIAKELSIKEEILNSYLTVVIKDKTVEGYYKKFEKEYVYKDYYVYNSRGKNRSLLYILAKKIGFLDEEIEIEEIKYSTGEYIKIPLAVFEKNKNIMQEMAELVRAVVGNVYVKGNGSLKITSIINQNDVKKINYTLKKGNILEYIEEYKEKKESNKIEVDYVENKIKPLQVVFALAGQNADSENDDAKVIVRANTTTNDTYWQIEYITDYVRNLESNPEVVAYKLENNNKVYIPYTDFELNIDETGGKVKFLNRENYDIYIEKFKIKGEPVKQYEGSKVTYTEKELLENEIELKTINNKYIQELKLAQENAKYRYFLDCRDVKKYSLICNSIPFIELEDVININYGICIKELKVIRKNQYSNRTELELIEFEIYSPNSQNWESQQANLFDKKLLQNGGVVDFGKIKYPENKPSAPIGITPEHQFLGFGARWQPLEAKDIKGYFMYVKSINETGEYTGVMETKINCGNSTYKLVKADVGSYEIAISSYNMNGIESDLSERVVARSLKVDGDLMNIDRDSLVVDTNTKKLMLGTVYARHLGANSVTASAIASNSITAEKLIFSENDGIFKKEDGSIGIDANKLTITGNTIFEGEVNLNGKIVGENGVIVESENKRTEIRGGVIKFLERGANNTFIETKTFRKMATDVYQYNPNIIKWVDVRSYTGNINWENVRITASLNRFDTNTSIKQILCEIVKHPTDKHLFYIKVGGSNILEKPYLLKTDEKIVWKGEPEKLVSNLSEYETKSFKTIENLIKNIEIVLKTINYKGISKLKVDLKNSRTNLKLRIRRSTFFGSLFGVKFFLDTIDFIVLVKMRYKKINTTQWSNWENLIEKDLDIEKKGLKYDVEIVLYYKISGISEREIKGNELADFLKNSDYCETFFKIWVSENIEGKIIGGSASWWAFEE